MTDDDLQDAERAEARDPHTRPERLLELLEFFDEVLENPAFALMLVERPDLWAELSSDALAFVASSPHCPPALASWVLSHQAEGHPEGRLWLNRALPRPLRRAAFLQMRSDDFDWEHFEVVHPRLLEVLSAEEHAVVAACEEDETQLRMTEEEVERLAGVGRVGQFLATWHPLASAALLEVLVASEDPAAAMNALSHPHLSRERLAVALESPEPHIRAAAAESPNLTAVQLQRAGTDPNPDVRAGMASSVALPEAWAARLAADPSWEVRHSLAFNKALSPELQWVLAADGHGGVRDGLLENPSLTPEARRRAEARNAEPA